MFFIWSVAVWFMVGACSLQSAQIKDKVQSTVNRSYLPTFRCL
jgi:hypothetical protein